MISKNIINYASPISFRHSCVDSKTAVMQSNRVSPKALGVTLMDNIKGRYLNEANAIAAEWRFLNAMPDYVKAELLSEIKNDVNIREANKELVIRLLSSDAESAREHILAEHKAGRYSKGEFVGKAKKEAYMWGSIAVMPVPIGGGIFGAKI